MKRLTVAIALILLCAGCDKMPEKASAPPTKTTAPNKSSATVSAEQKAFIDDVVHSISVSGRESGNFCADFQKRANFDGWVGIVSDFRTSTVNGSIDISIDMGQVQFEQVVQKADPLYPTIEALQVEGAVRVSGRFSHGNSECDYDLRTISVSLTKAQALPNGLIGLQRRAQSFKE